jgi:rRNA maturation RNase YbeY
MILIELNKQIVFRVPMKKLALLAKRAETALKLKGQRSVSLAVIGAAAMKRLNKHYRHKDKVTDVLSFEADEALDGREWLGEILICGPVCRKQAKEMRHSIEHEFQLLFVHGLLHLCGYDHEKSEADDIKMKKLETKILYG